jgi:AcrR family transcriptional regulator
MNHHKTRKQKTLIENSVSRRIIATARRHFFAYGFRAVTMDDLAEELGMSKKTLYAHFPSKTAIVEAVVLDKSREIEADLERITAEYSTDFLAELHQLLACMQQHLDEIRPPFARDVRREAPEIFQLVERRRRDLIHRHFAKLLSEGRDAGIIRKDIPHDLIIEILLGTVQAIMNPEKIAELNLTPKEAFSSIITVIFRGIVTETGRSKI